MCARLLYVGRLSVPKLPSRFKFLAPPLAPPRTSCPFLAPQTSFQYLSSFLADARWEHSVARSIPSPLLLALAAPLVAPPLATPLAAPLAALEEATSRVRLVPACSLPASASPLSVCVIPRRVASCRGPLHTHASRACLPSPRPYLCV